MLDSDASTAKTLTLVAIILQAVLFVAGLFIIIGLFAFAATSTTIGPGGTTTTMAPLAGIGLLGAIFAIVLAIGIIWILLEYFLIYKKLAEEKVAEAETPAIVLGIITLIFGGILTGILLIIAYVKIRDSIARHPPVYQYSYQQAPPPPSF